MILQLFKLARLIKWLRMLQLRHLQRRLQLPRHQLLRLPLLRSKLLKPRLLALLQLNRHQLLKLRRSQLLLKPRPHQFHKTFPKPPKTHPMMMFRELV